MSELHVGRIADVELGWGESARWDDAAQRLYFVDCAKREFAWAEGEMARGVERLTLPSLPTAVYLTANTDRVLVQLDDGLHAVSPSRKDSEPAIAAPAMLGRFNDGVTDPFGAIVTGSLLLGAVQPAGSYWRYSGEHGWQKLLEGKGNTNGPCVSPNGEYLYIADTTAGVIYRFAYSQSGRLGKEEVFADTRPLGGMPDGATLDSEGCLWSAIVGGGRVAQFAVDGTVKRVVDIPASHPTSVAFGGPDLDVLYVTTIGNSFPGIEATGALKGALLKIEGLGRRGLAANRCSF